VEAPHDSGVRVRVFRVPSRGLGLNPIQAYLVLNLRLDKEQTPPAPQHEVCLAEALRFVP